MDHAPTPDQVDEKENNSTDHRATQTLDCLNVQACSTADGPRFRAGWLAGIIEGDNSGQHHRHIEASHTSGPMISINTTLAGSKTCLSTGLVYTIQAMQIG